jgi:hypothetical protein
MEVEAKMREICLKLVAPAPGGSGRDPAARNKITKRTQYVVENKPPPSMGTTLKATIEFSTRTTHATR